MAPDYDVVIDRANEDEITCVIDEKSKNMEGVSGNSSLIFQVKIEGEDGQGKGGVHEEPGIKEGITEISQRDPSFSSSSPGSMAPDFDVVIDRANGDGITCVIDEESKNMEGVSGNSSREYPLNFQVKIEGEDGEGIGGVHEEPGINEGITEISQRDPSFSSSSPGSFDRNQPGSKLLHMEIPRKENQDTSFSGSTAQTEKNKGKNSRGRFAMKFLDEKTPLKKKLKWLKRFATVRDDGTVQFEVPSDIIKPQSLNFGTGVVYNDEDTDEATTDTGDAPLLRPLQIVMLIVGTRGDVQPFVAIGKRLQLDGHRVRLATHSNFKEFVSTAGLEFFPLGGDPKALAAYMVKNKGFLPSGPSEIHIQRNQIREIIFSLLPACVDPDPDTNVPFKVDAIIANPPAYGHIHVAEALKVPLHMIFTMPWTPTSEFPHPLSRVKHQVGYRLSYQIVDGLIWLGIRDVINEFRKKKLRIRPKTYLAGSYSSPTDAPYAYIWSPHLVPKPKDWGPNIDVVGFCFLDLASNYVPPDTLVKWLEGGEQPIYIGFGSLPVQEPEKMTRIIVRALEITGQRGIINRGWGGLGNLAEEKDSVYLLDNCPHDWLFTHCAAVVHHGGAGTTAAGLKAACPTTVVPFFGDQPFWGERVHARGVGPAPIPVDEFSLDKLVDAIRFMLNPRVKERARELAKAMENEDGVTGAVQAFYRHFPHKKSNPPQPEISPHSSYSKSHSHFSTLFGHCFGRSGF